MDLKQLKGNTSSKIVQPIKRNSMTRKNITRLRKLVEGWGWHSFIFLGKDNYVTVFFFLLWPPGSSEPCLWPVSLVQNVARRFLGTSYLSQSHSGSKAFPACHSKIMGMREIEVP